MERRQDLLGEGVGYQLHQLDSDRLLGLQIGLISIPHCRRLLLVRWLLLGTTSISNTSYWTAVLWSRSILTLLRLQLVKMAAPAPAPALWSTIFCCKKVLKFSLPILLGLVLFIERYECFLTALHLKGQINLLYDCSILGFLLFNHRSELELPLQLKPEPPLLFTAPAKKGGSGSTIHTAG